tara:strand:- start:89 stop:430 length:342 start_codon:yes stop_codon:yes gene_type:complete
MEAGNAVTLVALMVRNLETAFGAIPQQLRHLIPEFAGGGIVPGSVGQASLAVVHGGEQIIPVGAGARGGRSVTFAPQIRITDNVIYGDMEMEEVVVKAMRRAYMDGGLDFLER